MLSPKEYEAIGRFALAFSEIEYVLEVFTATTLGIPEWSVSVLLAEEGMFQKKADRFKRLLNGLEKEYPALAPQISKIKNSLKSAEEIAKERNRHVHAAVLWSVEHAGPVLSGREGPFECDAEKLAGLATSALRLAGDLVSYCGEFRKALDQIRRPRDGKTL